MKGWALAATVLFAGCIEYEDGQVEQGTLACQLHGSCDSLVLLGYDTVDECVADATHQDWLDCPDYSAERMQECIDAWQAAVDAADCAVDSEPPSVCAQVCVG